MTDTFDVLNPANGSVIQTITRDSEKAIEEKLEKGYKAFKKWKKTNAHERSQLLKDWSALIQKHKESIAKVMTEENGKPLAESRGEVDYATSFIDWYAEEAKRTYGRLVPTHANNKRIQVTKEPIGLVAAITPWNFPAAMMTRKAAPALAAGCTFICKPAEATPLTTMRLIELAHEAGFPVDAVQCINAKGSKAGDAFTNSKYVSKVTFTGSTDVGKSLIRKSADTVKAVTMELGGHAPVIVAKDADIDLAVEQTIASKFRNSGQTCICANRIFVHEAIAEEYADKLSDKSKELVVGNGLDENTAIGPIINEDGFDKIVSQIDDAIEKGAKLRTGATYNADRESQYFFVDPTIISNVTDEMDIMHDETFGPVAPITTFSNIDEAIQKANDTPFGLAAYYFTNDYRTGQYIYEHLDYGIIGWNDGGPSAAHAPFGGFKESGLGREGGSEGIEPYLETKYLSIGGFNA